MYILFIFTNIIVPVFIQMGIGFVMQKKFRLNINTLSKIQFYVFIPALLFVKIYESKLSKELFLTLTLFSILFYILIYLTAWTAAKAMRYPKAFGNAFINSISLYNSGNFCLPLFQLLYNNAFAISIQIINMMVQNILTNTVGIINTNASKLSYKKALSVIVKMPMCYVIVAAILLKALRIGIWAPVWSSLNLLGQALVPVALVTLGAQLANTRFSFKMPKVFISNFFRLILSPALAWLLVLLFSLEGVAGQVMVIAAAAPTAVNTVLLAIEYDNEPEFASQAVLTSTLLSSITVSMVIFLATKYI